MEVEGASPLNPLNLSLDDVIKLNRLRNQNEKSLETASVHSVHSASASPAVLTNGTPNLRASHQEKVNQRLMQNPDFGSRPIHHRLGYQKRPFLGQKKFFKKNLPPHFSPGNKMWWARQRVNQAKIDYFKKKNMIKSLQDHSSINSVISFKNPNFVQFRNSPSLNRFQIMKHNQMNGSIAPSFSAGSIRSLQTKHSVRPYAKQWKHSIKASLDPELQLLMRQDRVNLPMRPISVQHLNELTFEAHTTTITTHTRFSSYF